MIQQQFNAVGRLAADPSMRFLPSGVPVTSVNVAVNDGYFAKDKEAWVDRTLWVTLTFWNQAAERIAEKGHKGDSIVFDGKLVYDEKGNPRTFERKDGTVGSKFEVKVSEYQLFPKNGNGNGASPSDASAAGDTPPSNEAASSDDDNIPF